MKNTNDILLKNLSSMVYDNDYFEKELANYILNRLEVEEIKSPLNDMMGVSLCNFNIKGDLWSYVNGLYNPIFIDVGLEEFYVGLFNTNKSKHRIKHAEIEEKKHIEQIHVNKWKKILDEKSPELTKKINFFLRPYSANSKETKISSIPINLMDFAAIYNLEHWMLYNKKTDQFSEHGKTLIAYDLFSTGQSYNFSNIKYKISNYHEEISFIFKIMAENKTKIMSFLYEELDNREKKQEAEYLWINGLFNGCDNMKFLLNNAKFEDVKNLFSGEPFHYVSKILTLKDNVDNVGMYNNVIKIYSPEELISSYMKDDKFNINSYFNSRFKNTFGFSLVSNDKNSTMKTNWGTNVVPKVDNVFSLCEELKYLKDVIKNTPIDEKIYNSFWLKIIKTGHFDFIKSAHQNLELPNENAKEFYEEYNNAKASGKYMIDIRNEVIYEKLNANIPQIESTPKKIKI